MDLFKLKFKYKLCFDQGFVMLSWAHVFLFSQPLEQLGQEICPQLSPISNIMQHHVVLTQCIHWWCAYFQNHVRNFLLLVAWPYLPVFTECSTCCLSSLRQDFPDMSKSYHHLRRLTLNSAQRWDIELKDRRTLIWGSDPEGYRTFSL